MQTELIELAVAIVVLAVVMLVLRRASLKSRERSPASIRERLGYEEEEPQQARRRRRREGEAPKPVEAAKPAEAQKPARKIEVKSAS